MAAKGIIEELDSLIEDAGKISGQRKKRAEYHEWVSRQKELYSGLADLCRNLAGALERAIHLDSLGSAVFDIYSGGQLGQVIGEARALAERYYIEKPAVKPAKMLKEQAQLIQNINAKQSEFRSLINQFIASWRDTLKTTKLILTIPDIGQTASASREINEVISKIESFLDRIVERRNPSPEESKAAWEELIAKFNNLSELTSFEGLKEKFNLSAETIDLIKRLLVRDTPVWMSDLDEKVIGDIRRLPALASITKLTITAREV